MSILVRFNPSSLTAETYDAVSTNFEASPDWPPDGLDLHVCFQADDGLKVSEIWDSREQYEAFSERLLPVLARRGDRVRGTARDLRDPQHRAGGSDEGLSQTRRGPSRRAWAPAQGSQGAGPYAYARSTRAAA